MKLGRTVLAAFCYLCAWCAFFGCSGNGSKVAAGKSDAAAAVSDDALYVLDMQPAGVLPADMKYPAVYVQFSKPVVPVTVLGEPSEKSDLMKIEPPLEGVFRWYGTSLLCFDSSQQTVPQREYTVTLSGDIRAADGTLISGQTEFTFRTEELKLLSVTPGYKAIAAGEWVDAGDVPPEQARSIALVFSQPVTAKETAKYVEVSDEAGTVYPFDAAQSDEKQKQLLVLTLKKAPPENTRMTVTLKAGARSDAESLGTAQSDGSHSFHTLKPFSLEDIDTDGRSYGKYTNPVRFRFSHRLAPALDPAKLAAAVRTEPAMPVTAANVEADGSVLTVFGLPVTFDQQYTITLAAGAVSDVYGRPFADAAGPETVTVPEAASYAGFKDYGFGMLEAQFPPKLIFEYQNVLPGSEYRVKALTGAPAAQPADVTVLDETSIPKNVRVLQPVDLLPFLTQTDHGAFGAVSFSAVMKYNRKDYYGETRVSKMENGQTVQVTDLGLTVRYGYNRVLVLVTSLATGKPVPGAAVKLYTYASYSVDGETVLTAPGTPAASGVTDENGFVRIDLEPNVIGDSVRTCYVSAEKDGDRAVFNPSGNRLWQYAGNVRSPQNARAAQMVTFMFTDRGLYKPGETMQLRGIDRNLQLGSYEPYAGPYTLSIRENTWRSKPFVTATGSASESGGFTGKFTLPQELAPGSYLIEYTRTLNGRSATESIPVTVAYFERLRFETAVSIPTAVPYVSGDRIPAAVSASYLGGGSLAGAQWNAEWYREPAGFRPDGARFDGYRFGPRQGYDGRSALSSEEGALDGTGKASASQLSGGETIKGMAYSYRVESTVFDAGSQAVSSSASVVVHPAQYYIGLSAAKGITGFAKKGTELSFDYLLAQPDGSAPAEEMLPRRKSDCKLSVELLREDWKQVRQMGLNGQIITRYVREMVSESTSTVPLAASGTVSVTPPKGGAYVLRLSAQDSGARAVVTERSFYVTGSDWNYYYGNESQEITLLPDKDVYQAGDTARILLQSPLPAGTYLMTVEREGVFSEQVFRLTEPSTVLEVPVTDRYLPVAYVTVSSYSTRTKKPDHDYATPDMDKPKGYFGAAAIRVDPVAREFDITVTQDKPSYRPGDTATITLSASKAGQPLAGAELTLMAVDRGVIDLINYHVPDPVAHFYNEYLFFSAVAGGDSRSLLIDPVTYEVRNLFGGDEGGDKIEERKNFDPTAVFVPVLTTGADGTVSYSFTLPDTITAYRITAVGVLSDYFGISEAEMSVNKPVSVRDVLPRRLREHDTSDAGVVISSLDGRAHEVTVSMEIVPGSERAGVPAEENGVVRRPGRASAVAGTAAANGGASAAGAGAAAANGGISAAGAAPVRKTVTVPAGKTVPLMFDISAQEYGFVSVVFKVESDVVTERIVKVLEIDRPYVFETVTTVGDVSSGSTDKKGAASVTEKIVLPVSVAEVSAAAGTTAADGTTVTGGSAMSADGATAAAGTTVTGGSAMSADGTTAAAGAGTLFVQLDPTRLGTLTEAVSYVFRYPYGCLEQRCSAMIPLLYFEKYIDVFGMQSEVSSPKKVIEREIADWAKTQQSDGGFPYWKTSSYSSFAPSLRFAELIASANLHGITVPRSINVPALSDYLSAEVTRSWYRGNAYVQAYTLFVLMKLTGSVDERKIDGVCGMPSAGYAEKALCGLMYVSNGNRQKAEAVAKDIRAHVRPTTRGADVTDSRFTSSPWMYFNDVSERNALLLQFFTALDPSDDLNGRFLFNLLEIQRAGNGYWKNTASTARVLEAVASYIEANNLESLDFSAEATLAGNGFVSGSFKGAAAKPVEKTASFAELAADGAAFGTELPLEVSKDGRGTLFYTVSMKYPVPADKQYARDEGLSVFVDITDVKTGKPVAGSALVSGTVYRARATLSTTKDRTFVALRVPIPSGAEVLNAAFATSAQYAGTGSASDDTGADGNFISEDEWFERYNFGLSGQEIYDNEVRYFWDAFRRGRQQVEFLFRAVRSGSFTVPGATAECMYEPEIFGRSKGGVVVITEK